MLVEYAVRSGILPEDSVVAVAVGDAVSVQHIRAKGATLEALGFVRALSSAYEAGVCGTRLQVGPRMMEMLEQYAAGLPVEASSALVNVNRLLALVSCEMVVSTPSERLAEVLALQPLTTSDWTLQAEDAAWVEANDARVVFTDGSCSAGMVGAWAWYVDETLHDSGPVPHVSTSLTAERKAIAEALSTLTGPLLVLSDCEPVLTSSDSVIEALGLADPLDGLLGDRTVRFSHVKGHATCVGNRRADSLARQALGSRLQALDEDPDLDALHQASSMMVACFLEKRPATIRRRLRRKRKASAE